MVDFTDDEKRRLGIDDLTDEEMRELFELAKKSGLIQIIINRRYPPVPTRPVGQPKKWTHASLRELWLTVECQRQIHKVPLGKINYLMISVFRPEWGGYEALEVDNANTVKRLYRQATQTMKKNPTLARQWTRELEDLKRPSK